MEAVGVASVAAFVRLSLELPACAETTGTVAETMGVTDDAATEAVVTEAGIVGAAAATVAAAAAAALAAATTLLICVEGMPPAPGCC